MSTRKEILERPFDPALIRTRKGPFGQTISYIAAEDVIRRLNEAGDWSFEVVSHEIRDTEVIVLGKLTMDGIVKMAFGSSAITTSREGEVISVGDDLKSAATDACKKAAQMLGVALGLNGDVHSAVAPGNGNGAKPAGSNGNGHGPTAANGNGHGTAAAAPADRLTQRQHSAILAIARRSGISAEHLRQRCSETYGVPVAGLCKTDASRFIEVLQAESVEGAEASP